MSEAIEAKYGRGVLQRVAFRSNSLNSVGKGFKDAHPAGIKTTEALLIQQFGYKTDFRLNRRLLINVSFEVEGRQPTPAAVSAMPRTNATA